MIYFLSTENLNHGGDIKKPENIQMLKGQSSWNYYNYYDMH